MGLVIAYSSNMLGAWAAGFVQCLLQQNDLQIPVCLL